ncbi:BofC C-terminal domain-containing protein [Paenibacillus sp. JX-17]|uniref:BofC C-terminal domain-containing protein n=1 Tax=Paenibacillus lacisoli TaxID=3064525 RepID=A0ABT9CFM3_9BACL|nr:BofC C-terminal domain-containing protein [Paenibacillus sp. JX-17]MDO7908074.1 BofC C-terminal domain-containing protein [Paenibacillus sp. JX-17]
MIGSKLKKQLLRRWRKRRKSVWTGLACGIMAVLLWTGMHMSGNLRELMSMPLSEPAATAAMASISEMAAEINAGREETELTLRASDQAREVYRIRHYICGSETEKLGTHTSAEAVALVEQHLEWKSRIDQQGALVLEMEIADLSPKCKQAGYMSLDSGGKLALFEGPPKKEKVIRTFFQLDLGSMETSLPEGVLKQLQQGIRIQDVDEYNSVISTFSDYALKETKRVMKPLPNDEKQ